MTAHEQARQTRTRYKADVVAIRQDRTLTADSRNARLAKAYVGLERELTRLRDQHRTVREAERTHRERAVFAAPVDPEATPADRAAIQAGYRDALDRAAQARRPGDAVALLDRAHRIGDELLARAVAAVSAERGWSTPIARYTDRNPDAAAAIRDLEQYNADVADPQQRMAEGLVFSAGAPPAELGSVRTGRIDQLASQAD